MQKLKSKTMAILIALLLTFSMTASMILVPTTIAHSPAWQIPTISYINVAPNPVGVGQTLTIGFWLMEPPPTAGTIYGDRWQNMTVKVTLPDGTTKTLGPFTSDDTGGTFTTYTPSQLGNYTFQMNFGGQTLAGTNPPPGGFGLAIPFLGDYFEPSVSKIATLTVQQEAIASIPWNPLPTTYWTRPINAENPNWYSIAGNWLGFGGLYNVSSNYNPWSTAPLTAHILWTKPAAFGGTVGGEFGGSETGNFYTNREYEPSFKPIIMDGILYYTEYPVGGALTVANLGTSQTGWVAVDLQTGQTLWTDNAANYGGGSPQHTALTASGAVTILACGQLLDYVSPNQYGVSAYLWSSGNTAATGTPVGITSTGTTWNMFDAMTGTYILSIVNGSAMTLTEDQGGDLIGYYVNSSTANAYHAPTLNMWNSTWCIQNYDNITAYAGGLAYPMYINQWEWRPIQGSQIPFSDGIMWSMPLPTNISGVPLPATLGISAVNSGVLVMSATTYNTGGGSSSSSGGATAYQAGWQIEAGFSADTGAQLWIVNRTETPFTLLSGPSSFLDGCGVYVVVDWETFTATGYSDYTGAQLWTTVFPNANAYDSLHSGGMVANGTLYFYCLGGDVYAMNILTGAILWHYNTGSAGYDTPYGIWPIWSQGPGEAIAGGMLFFSEGHEYSPPLFRGANVVALNLTDGQPVWSILGFDVENPPAISDGVLTMLNDYDRQIYGYGMGPSATTVTAPDPITSVSAPMIIRGTVTDISAGSTQEAVAANFPNGLPCVSDASMTQFMEAVYEQQPMPTNVTGVPVTISVLDSNGNYRQIGTTTSNADGMFTLTWTPDISGNYTVIANFAGSESYYPSHADTSFYVSAPAPTASPYPTVNLPPTEMYFAVSTIAIIIAIAIVGFLILRKHP